MKLPSLIRLPNHTRFNIKPRYYDPVKEDLEERIARIKAEVAKEKGQPDIEYTNSAISGSFRSKSKVNYASSASGRQLIIALILSVSAFGWLYYGNKIFYLATLAFPIFIHYHLKNKVATMSATFTVIAYIGYYILGWQFPFLQEFVVLCAVVTAYFWIKTRMKKNK